MNHAEISRDTQHIRDEKGIWLLHSIRVAIHGRRYWYGRVAVVRNLRWAMVGFQMIFATVFGAAGFGMLTFSVRRVTTRSGKNSSTSESVLWQDEQLIARDFLQNDPARSAIPVLFQIPYDCRPTDETNASDQTIWRLEVSAKTPWLDYSTTFDVPVFKTPESDPNFVVDHSLIAEYAAPENLDRDLHEAGVVKMESPTGEGCRLVFPN